MIIMAQRMYAATTSFPPLAIPLFILAGNLMNTGGMTQLIFRVARLRRPDPGRRGPRERDGEHDLRRHVGIGGGRRGGPGDDRDRGNGGGGLPQRFAAGITAVSATIGPIIPPSIPFVIYGALANVSIGALFLAGVVPGC